MIRKLNPVLAVLFPFWLILAGYLVFTAINFGLSWDSAEVIAAAAEKITIDSILFFVLLTVLGRLRWLRLAQLPFVFLYFAAFFLEAGVFVYGQTRLERQHINLFWQSPLSQLLSPAVFGLLAILIFAVYVEWRVMRRTVVPDRLIFFFSILIFPLILAPDLSIRVVGWKVGRMEQRGADEQEIEKGKYLGAQLQYLRSNSFLRLTGYLFSGVKEQLNFQTVAGTRGGDAAVARYNLPLGARRYPEIGIEPFTRVILLTVDSLSLDLLAPYNSLLPNDLTHFYNQPEIVKRMFTNLRSSEVSTLGGLAVIFNSHPNAVLFGGAEEQPLSMVDFLKASGFRTVHMRSTSSFYGFDEAALERSGFGEVINREDLKQFLPRQYFTQSGLMDRLLLQAAAERLKLAGNQRIFLHLLTADTHPLDGRSNYDGLEYPRLPVVLPVPKASQPIYSAVLRHSFDIGLFFEMLRQEQLYDKHTLLIVTADHCFPLNKTVTQIPGYPNSPLCRLPFVILTPADLPPPVALNSAASQLDIAPTIFHLLSLDIPEGWWGESLFYPGKKNPVIGAFRNTIYLTPAAAEKSRPAAELRLGFETGYSPEERSLLDLFWSVVPQPEAPAK